MTQVDGGNTAKYNYDAFGNRTMQYAPPAYNEYMVDLTGRAITAIKPGTSTVYTAEVFAGGRHWVTDNGSALFLGVDWVGTSRALTNLSGTFDQLYTSLPWGDALSFAGGSSFHTTSQYTGKECDSESGLYHFPARQYATVQGRWLTPDPAGLAAMNIANPQSWNRYAYVMNNPVSNFDPLGLFCPVGACDEGGGGDPEPPSDPCFFEPEICTFGPPPPVLPPGAGPGGGPPPTPPSQNPGQNNNPANNKGCPSGTGQIVNQVALSITNGSTVALGLKWAALSNSVVQIGIGASGAYQAPWSPLGWGGSGSITLAFDPNGNIGLAVSYGDGPTFGEGVMGGVQFSRSPNAQSIFDLNGPSTSKGAGAADGFGASYDYSNNAGGTDSLTVGGGVGGIGSFNNTGPTTVYPLVCR